MDQQCRGERETGNTNEDEERRLQPVRVKVGKTYDGSVRFAVANRCPSADEVFTEADALADLPYISAHLTTAGVDETHGQAIVILRFVPPVDTLLLDRSIGFGAGIQPR